jgi:hypothetical protein
MAALTRELLPLAILVTPNLPEAALLTGRPIAEDEAEMARQAEALMRAGARSVLIKGGHHRYVVWHQPSEATLENLPGSWAAEDAASFVRAAFGGAPPSVQEPLVRVWTLPAADLSLPAEPVVELGSGWYAPEPEWRWAASPAEIAITASRSQEAELTMSVRLIHDRNSGRGLGDTGVLIVTSGRDSVSRPITRGEPVRIPITLSPGRQIVSLSLGAGNFRPTEFHETDRRPLSFAIEWLELTTKQEKGPGVISRGHPTPGNSAAVSQ